MKKIIRFDRKITTTFMLTESVKVMLDRMSKKEGLNKSNIVRQLIETQYQEGDYGEEGK